MGFTPHGGPSQDLNSGFFSLKTTGLSCGVCSAGAWLCSIPYWLLGEGMLKGNMALDQSGSMGGNYGTHTSVSRSQSYTSPQNGQLPLRMNHFNPCLRAGPMARRGLCLLSANQSAFQFTMNTRATWGRNLGAGRPGVPAEQEVGGGL